MFCIITPVFDDAYRSVNMLIKEMQYQTYGDFQHVMISNGPSPKVKAIIEKHKDERFVYEELPFVKTPEIPDLLANISKRRRFCLNKYEAGRYFFFDADLLIATNEFFESIKNINTDVIISKVQFSKKRILPQAFSPLYKFGEIDISNYSFSNKVARKYEYPENRDGGDAYRFYLSFSSEQQYFNDCVYAIKNGRLTYKNIRTIFSELS